MTASASRLAYLDWLRGAAVLIMIEAHAVDAWTQASDRSSRAYAWAIITGGMGAPLFLFLAGVAVALAGDSRARRTGDPMGAARSVRRRGWQIFGLAFLFRLQSFLLSPGTSPAGLLKVDILNIMGPSIVVAAWLWQLGRSPWGRAAVLASCTAAVALATPLVRATGVLDAVPDTIEAYLRPVAGRATFTFFPWSGFVFAGAVAGLLIAAGRQRSLARSSIVFAVSGVLLAAIGYAASFAPSPFHQSSFWTSSPAFFCLRVGLMTFFLALAYGWAMRPWRLLPWSPVEVLGVSSLFVYWIHVEMVYGALSTPIKRALPLPGVFAAWLVFAGLMLAAVFLKTWVVGWWHARRSRAPRPLGV